MAWERRSRPPHACQRPNVRQVRSRQVGDVWRCRRCGARWALTFKGLPARGRVGPLHENAWRRCGPLGAELPPPPRQTGTDWLTTALD